MLLGLSLAMLIGCFLAGSLPLAFQLSEDKLQHISVMGAGLLVGTALAVIIPEGVSFLLAVGHAQVHRPNSTDKPVTSESDDQHKLIGSALVAGFLFMVVVEQISTFLRGAEENGTKFMRLPTTEGQNVEASGSSNGTRSPSPSNALTATLGLIVHAAVDGIALGAAATTKHQDTEMIVFLAIMLHKAPAALGLVTFLLHSGMERSRIRRHLLIFSLAAPVLAVITFCLVGVSSQALVSRESTGLAMLFSAGTFLYVATVHVLPEVTREKKLRTPEVVLFMVGTLCPLLLAYNHKH